MRTSTTLVMGHHPSPRSEISTRVHGRNAIKHGPRELVVAPVSPRCNHLTMTIAGNTEIGPQPGDDVTEIAEATAEALDEIRKFLVVLRRDAPLTDHERRDFDAHLQKIEEIASWADPKVSAIVGECGSRPTPP